jgi:hypothetical protein
LWTQIIIIIIFLFTVQFISYFIFLRKIKIKICGQSPSTPPHCTSTHLLESPSLLTVTVAVPFTVGIPAPALAP